jgi:hypothetical protein
MKQDLVFHKLRKRTRKYVKIGDIAYGHIS